jgi:chromosomal replication initiation ATPase DnaA
MRISNEEIEIIRRVVRDVFQAPDDYHVVKSRKEEIVEPRKIFMWAMNEYSGWTLKEIGRFCGGRDHSTVINARDFVRDQMDVNRAYRKKMQQLTDYLDALMAAYEQMSIQDKEPTFGRKHGISEAIMYMV